MTALVPVPASQTTDATAAPFTLTASTRLVAAPSSHATAVLAAAALAPLIGRTLEIIDDLPATGSDIVLEEVAEGGPEAYRLTASADGVRIAGGGQAGVFYGVQTLVQLVAASATIQATVIDDAPRFAYRGVMLDVARHFFPLETVTGYIDRAAALKFNALHLHLTDDQGWRIELATHPELTRTASATAIGGDPGGFFTKDDYARIIAHAAARHMIVVPEVDGPGHTHAVGLSHPELVEAPVITEHITDVIEAYGGGMPQSGRPYTGLAVGFSSLRIHDEATYAFLGDVYRELAEMTPGPYLHVDGDEALGTDPADFAVFMSRATRMVTDLGKTPIAWHEAGAVADLSPDTIGQYWGYVAPADGMDEKARAFTQRGSRVILSPADAIYLDMKLDPDSPLGLTWADGPTSVRDSYAWEPAELIHGIDERDILGIEAPMWSETLRTAADLDSQAFPRIASAAEIGWSPARHEQRTWESFRSRVGGLAALWRRQGIAFTRAAEIDWS